MRAVLLSLTLPNYLLTLFTLDIIFSLAKSSIRNLPESFREVCFWGTERLQFYLDRYVDATSIGG
jgi:hypothetical protein